MIFNATVRATISGATAQVEATTLKEAHDKVEKGLFIDGIDLKTGELVDWKVELVYHEDDND
jgi:hypothetical protein